MASLRDRRVRGIWEDRLVTALASFGPAAVEPLREALHDRSGLIQSRAARALKAIRGEAADEALREYVTRLYTQSSPWQRHRYLLEIAKLGPLLWLPMCIMSAVTQSFVFAAVGGLATMACQAVERLMPDQTVDARRIAFSVVIERNDLRDIALLARCLHDDEPGIRKLAAEAIRTTLSTLRASDAHAIPDSAMNALIKELRGADTLHESDVEVTVAILKALEQIGDERALPEVQRIARGLGKGHYLAAQHAAEECLPALQTLVGRSQRAGALLRPSEGVHDTPSTLVRPAEAAPGVGVNLARPANPAEDSTEALEADIRSPVTEDHCER